MSQLRNSMRKLLRRFSQEANKIRDPEARSRWMRIKKITESGQLQEILCIAQYGPMMSHCHQVQEVLLSQEEYEV